MSETRQLEGMTVVELRKYAKDNGIPLSTVTTKTAIIEKISNALTARENRSVKSEAESEISRRATIITDDVDESAVLTSTPVPRQQPDKTRTSTGKVKPVFTLQGSRAWHNPQPFAQTQAPQSKYAPNQSQSQGSSPFARDSGGMDSGAYAPARQRVMTSKVSRFGPAASGGIPEPSIDALMPVPEPRTFAPAPLPRRQGYQSSAYHSVLPVGQTGANEASIIPEVSLTDFEFQPQEMVKDFRMNPAVPEMLATGDCGDGAGILEIQQDGYGFLRASNLLPGKNDVYVSGTQIRRFRMRNGDYVVGKTRPQRENDRYAAMLFITSINGEEPDSAAKMGGSPSEANQRRDFDELTPTYPTRRIALSSREENDLVLRLIDLFVPVGFGQRAMIVAAPKAGKTTILKKIALSLKRNHPDVHTMMLLVDERPEEVTDLKETVGGDIFYSTFDEPAESHAKVSELTLERAMRLVEMGKDVVVLLDSLTRLSRAYNTLMPGSARVMTGGLAAGAMNKPKRFFGAARSLKEGGSLTIIATALVDTGSRMDGVIFEEFKGTGNMELTLDRQLSERRLFPAVSLPQSGTRHDELLLTQKEMEVAAKVRDRFSFSSEQESISLLLSMLEKSRDNEEFVSRYDDWMKLLRSRD